MRAYWGWFAIAGGLGVVILTFGWWLGARLEAGDLRARNAELAVGIEQGREVLYEEGALEARLKGIREKGIKRTGERLAFRLDFPAVPEGMSPETFLRDQLLKRQDTLEKRIKKSGFVRRYTRKWDLDARIKGELEKEKREELKLRIAISDHVVSTALSCGVEVLERLKQRDVEEEPAGKGDLVVRRCPVSFEIVAGQESLARFLAELTVAGRFLHVTEIKVEPDKRLAGRVRAALTVAAVEVAEKKGGKESTSPRGKPPRRGVRPPRRRY